jgi:outer membrane protein OmpA-like peptidoglycan-associated protein
MARTGIFRRVGVTLVALACVTAVMGGCNKDRKAADALRAENEEMASRLATLDQAARDKDARLLELEARMRAAEEERQRLATAAAAQPQPAAPTGGTNFGSGGSGGSDFARDGDGNMRARLSGDVLFDPGQVSLKASSRQTLDRIARELRSKYSGSSIRVEGHTDSDPIRKSKFASNQALSEARAEAVRKYLIGKGVSADSIDAVGYGSSRARSTKAASRRVEIVIGN